MNHLVKESKLRDEILKLTNEINTISYKERRIILLSINVKNTLSLIRKFIPNIYLFLGMENPNIELTIEDLIKFDFTEGELYHSLMSKCTFEKDKCILTENPDFSIELNSYNEHNESILFSLLSNNLFSLLSTILKGANVWNDYSIFTRNMNNEIFIFNLYKRKEEDLKVISRSLIFDQFNLDNINIQNEEGNSLLHLAILNNDKELANFCLLNGANPYLKNHFNLTPFENQDLTYWEDEINAFSVEVNV